MEISTPLGNFDLPKDYEKEYLKLSDIELLNLLVIQSRSIIDPVLVQILVNKQLLLPSEKVSDIMLKIEKLKGSTND